MWGWRKDFEDAGRARGKFDYYERRLWLVINRYVRKDLAESPHKTKGLTLLFGHATGVNKEAWEPTIMSLLKSRAGQDVEEIWVWDSVDSGDSALLNAGRLNQLSDWYDTARDIAHFLFHYMPSGVVSDGLPVHLPRIPVAEFNSRINRGFSERKIVAISHSFSGAAVGRVCSSYPQLFTAMVFIDPAMIKHDLPVLKPSLNHMAQGAFAREGIWKSRDEALASLQKSLFYGVWHPDARKLYVECAMYPTEWGTIKLKMHPVWEALSYTNGKEPSGDMYERLPSLDGKIYIKWIMPDPKTGGGLGGNEASKLLVKRRPGRTSNVNILGAGHMIPQEKPKEVGE
ncbi:Alpha/beta hydrolase fold-1 [Rhodocollybia butyracea]|uniref:Alpha/beta hydrolase fold-1 n=1 Tax=Rhodocollybia butyracea TaxID=206335 RepID=A0A9P5U7L4_9AGAR|nr:Alpha/beta hydrolase fold-1 [Rhodocollybia butyracea]